MDFLVSGVASGAAGGLVKSMWDSFGGRWVDAYWERHRPEAQRRAREQAQAMLASLAERLSLFEQEMTQQGKTIESLDKTLSEPDFSAVLESAIIAAARTDDHNKHQLISRMIAERLIAPTDDLRILVAPLVVDAIPRLGKRHLEQLALAALVSTIRPLNLLQPLSTSWDQQEYRDWWQAALSFYPEVRLQALDMAHLMSVSCAVVETHNSDLAQTLTIPGEKFQEEDTFIRTFLQDTEEGRRLEHAWNTGLGRLTLTSVGMLIGTYVHDLYTGVQTNLIVWSIYPGLDELNIDHNDKR